VRRREEEAPEKAGGRARAVGSPSETKSIKSAKVVWS
jgi:hypothetical protein